MSKTIHIDLEDVEVTIELEGEEAAVQRLYDHIEETLLTASAMRVMEFGMVDDG